MKTVKVWIEAMRLRTLPVSAAGVTAACAYAVADACFGWTQAILCLMFAVLAQVASNFANEYYDFKSGLDRKGREGPRRGVTEGDISPRAMLVATYATLAVASVVGMSLLWWGGWILLPVGMVVVAGAIAYSAGPYPLSRHGLGEVAVILFFGIIPVCMTYWLMAQTITMPVFLGSLAIGLGGANVLIVNNYRDIEDDCAVGKRTLAVMAGPRAMRILYFVNWFVAAMLIETSGAIFVPVGIGVFILGMLSGLYVARHERHELNNALKYTSLLTFAASVALLLTAVVCR